MVARAVAKTYIGLKGFNLRTGLLEVKSAKSKQVHELRNEYSSLSRGHLDVIFGQSTANNITIVDTNVRVPSQLLNIAIEGIRSWNTTYPIITSKGLSYKAMFGSEFGSWKDLITGQRVMLRSGHLSAVVGIKVPTKTLVWLKKDHTQKDQIALYFCIKTKQKDRNELILAMLQLAEVKIEDEVTIEG
jgi:hypothetical protein